MSPIADYLIQATTTLAGVVALAVLILFGSRRFSRTATGPLELVGQLPLEGRRAVYLVRIGPRVFALAASESSIVNLGEITDLDTLRTPSAPRRSFRELFEQLRTSSSVSSPSATEAHDKGASALDPTVAELKP